MLAHNILYGDSSSIPTFISDLASDALDHHSRITRNVNYTFTLPVKFKQRVYGKSTLYNCFKLFNALPLELRKVKVCKVFKYELLLFLSTCDNHFYSDNF